MLHLIYHHLTKRCAQDSMAGTSAPPTTAAPRATNRFETTVPQESARTYSLAIDLTVLDHLADGLYSSVAAVLTEAVANAWDADARTVHLNLDIANDAIYSRSS